LKAISFTGVDLSEVDFSGFDLTETVLDSVTLKQAKLTPRAFGPALDIRYSAWWEASEIDPKALGLLIANHYPYTVPSEIYPSGDVEESTYRKEIERLCKPRRPACEPDSLIFGKKAN
jgi:hypothetical protein